MSVDLCNWICNCHMFVTLVTYLVTYLHHKFNDTVSDVHGK